ncbi:unnamed protein product [Mytilus edulis]|uniref:Uncharacterized protein n=1 Tax=Mytilus edulis TaxID=6550 RepID=A0A8S3R8G7_MYTED|nr:unnamed protein product [Mytilus edulis]
MFYLFPAFFGTAFPKKGSRVNIKCFLPFKGDYTIETIFEGENKGSNVTKICPGGNETHHYNLYCDSDHNTGCNPSKCSVECNKFRISLSKMHMVLIDLDDSCLSLNGRFAIWNSTMINSQETSAHT